MWITPDLGESNPYLRLLARALEGEGVQATLLSSTDFLRRMRGRGPFPDVVHLQWQHPFLTSRSQGRLRSLLKAVRFLQGCRDLRRRGVGLLWTVHNLVNHERVHAGIETQASRVLARMVDAVVVHGASVVPEVSRHLRIGPDRCRVVPHGHYGDAYPHPPSRRDAREQLGLSHESRVFLYFGMIRGYKGLRDLMESFDEARPPRSELLIAGTPKDSRLAGELEEWAATRSHVRLDLGLVPDRRLVQYVAASDVIVLPFSSSLTSGSAILAASLSRPIIAPRTGCLVEFPAEAGLFYTLGSAQGLQKALAAADSAPLDEMGAAAARYISGFPWSSSAQATAAVYAEALGRSRSLGRLRAETLP